MVFENRTINEQMIHFGPAQGVAAIGFATIFKKMGANWSFVEARGGRLDLEALG